MVDREALLTPLGQFVDRIPDADVLRDQNDARARALLDERCKVPWHGAAIVSHEDPPFVRGTTKDLFVGETRQVGFTCGLKIDG
ncbi:MAG: hypothetical protein GEV06_11300 [Luteitalea sp.]|nr:hypothetical protein [Luteitalea sp.]